MRPLAIYLRWEIFERSRYVRKGFELRLSDTVVDIGGNIGSFVLLAAPQVRLGLDRGAESGVNRMLEIEHRTKRSQQRDSHAGCRGERRRHDAFDLSSWVGNDRL
jgi:hypothetical protein